MPLLNEVEHCDMSSPRSQFSLIASFVFMFLPQVPDAEASLPEVSADFSVPDVSAGGSVPDISGSLPEVSGDISAPDVSASLPDSGDMSAPDLSASLPGVSGGADAEVAMPSVDVPGESL